MPSAAPHICSSCKQLTQGPCSTCAKPTAKGWRNDDGRIRGRKLQTLRAQLFAQEPFCRACATRSLEVLATVRDHIIPLAEGGTDDPSNIQPLCQDCSDAKTKQEAKRGRRLV